MDRRGFLQLLLPAAIGGLVLAEELLWTPTRKIFLPPKGGWQVNQLGGYYYSRQLSEVLRESVKRHQTLVRAMNDPSALAGLDFCPWRIWTG
jgi:hypothetical protein